MTDTTNTYTNTQKPVTTKRSKNKTIVALACSPTRNGNSEILLDAFLEGVATVEGVQVQRQHIEDVPLAYYDFAHRTPNVDEEPEFLALCDRLKQANGLIIATPTYNFGVPARLKNFVDRIGFFSLDYQTLNKLKQPTGQLGYLSNFYIVTGGTPSLFQKFIFMLFPGFWLRAIFTYYGAKRHRAAYAGPYTFSDPVKNDPQKLASFRAKGAAYAKWVVARD